MKKREREKKKKKKKNENPQLVLHQKLFPFAACYYKRCMVKCKIIIPMLRVSEVKSERPGCTQLELAL